VADGVLRTMLEDLERELALGEVKIKWYTQHVETLESRTRRTKDTLEQMKRRQSLLRTRVTVLRNKLKLGK